MIKKEIIVEETEITEDSKKQENIKTKIKEVITEKILNTMVKDQKETIEIIKEEMMTKINDLININRKIEKMLILIKEEDNIEMTIKEIQS